MLAGMEPNGTVSARGPFGAACRWLRGEPTQWVQHVVWRAGVVQMYEVRRVHGRARADGRRVNDRADPTQVLHSHLRCALAHGLAFSVAAEAQSIRNGYVVSADDALA
jgi:hypothetical protein